ncbi:hypothetical protein NX059_000526 [Plenodomus lindquistii]|nr:hypothetical protein NX059_000526 [Plenodomus lindquistii]
MSNDIVSNRSTLKEFLASIATISGDLSNITAPPFVLAENSTVEIPQYWADHPHLFVAPAAESDPEKRALLVLKWFLGSLRNQQYAGRKEEDGVKKPLNAFLGELFFGSWADTELGETRLVSEQVSHHPPITACYLWNDKHGVRAEGFTQQQITFNGAVSIKQKGYAVLHIDKFDENYLVPVPNVKVKGIISGVPYPELQGEYSLISSSGYVSHVKFDGKGFFGTGTKNGFSARLYHQERPKDDLYTVKGAWNGASTIVDARSGAEIGTFDVGQLQSAKLETAELSEQDPWESRRAWGGVIAALRRSDMRETTNAKSRVEQGQRQMRKDEEAQGTGWRNLFFQAVEQDAVFEQLSVHDTGSYTVDRNGGIWKVDVEAVKNAKKPYHGDLLPTNERADGVQPQRTNSRDKAQEQPQTPPSAAAAPASPVAHSPNSATQHQSADDNVTSSLNGQMADVQPDEQPTKGMAGGSANALAPNGSVQEPTDEQVEEFLRARHSNVH